MWAMSQSTRWGWAAAEALPLVLAGATTACTALKPEDSSLVAPLSTSDGGTVAPLGSDWACLTTPTPQNFPPSPPLPAPATIIKYIVPIVDFTAQPTMLTAISGLAVSVCGDVACQTVLTTNVTHPNNIPYLWEFDLPSGTVNATLKTHAAGYVDFNTWFGGPIMGTPTGSTIMTGLVIPPISESYLSHLYVTVGAEQPRDMEKGILAIRVLNCYLDATSGSPDQTKSRGNGVQITVIDNSTGKPPAPPAVGWTLGFSNEATVAGQDGVLPKTDSRGVGGYFELEPGGYTVTAKAPNGTPLYKAESFSVSPNQVTLAALREGLDEWGE
jgi:hypothetical protein